MTTRTCSALSDRGWTSQVHPLPDSGPCKGHRCDGCRECRGGTCCGTLLRPINREGNPALSPKLHGPATAEPGIGT